MMLDNGFYDVPKGRVATVVTHLEMREKAPLRPVAPPSGLTLRRVEAPGAAWYRALFRRVGAEDWLWFSRLQMGSEDLEAIIRDPKVQVFTLSKGDTDLALLELDFRKAGACELAFFGVAKELMGTGTGRFLMNEAIRRAWAEEISLFHVHTCTLDSPQALSFYMRSGFVPVRQQIEIAPDPRLEGLIPETAAPQIPIFR